MHATMVTVFIPSLMRDLTGGAQTLKVKARTVQAAIAAIEARHPGLQARLIKGERLRSGLMVVIDGRQAEDGLRASLLTNSELHFVPSLAGGASRAKSSEEIRSLPGMAL